MTLQLSQSGSRDITSYSFQYGVGGHFKNWLQKHLPATFGSCIRDIFSSLVHFVKSIKKLRFRKMVTDPRKMTLLKCNILFKMKHY